MPPNATSGFKREATGNRSRPAHFASPPPLRQGPSWLRGRRICGAPRLPHKGRGFANSPTLSSTIAHTTVLDHKGAGGAD